MDEVLLYKIMATYGFADVQFRGAEKGYRNSSHHVVTKTGQHLNLIIYKSEPGILDRIKRTNYVADYASANGLPARRTADSRILQLRAGTYLQYAALYAYLPGNTIPWEAYTMEHIKLLGKSLSDLHAVLSELPRRNLPYVDDEYTAVLKRMERYFADPDVHEAIGRKLGITVPPSTVREYRKLLGICRKLAGQQVLHMDFVRGNILFSQNAWTSDTALQVSGVLDFEKTAFGHPLFDVARTLAFLLVDCKYKRENKIRKYFLASGYNKRGAQQIIDITIPDILKSDISILERLLDMFLLHDFYKFLRHNPYESLAENEHFMRTKQILINRNIIRELEMVE
jgi:Ser/Thr protein kinase RdoA (MazF antagonist)